MEQDYIKLIFGLKLKQIRTDRELSLFGLSKLSGLSKSYLNEIEKGKKYPKPDKIAALSEHLDVPYDEMVSLKLDKNLAPIGEILQSKLLKEIPLELFGIQESTMIDIISNAPSKVTAFISTIIEIAKNYSFSKESFYLASVRSFQEANNNYFNHLEQAVIAVAKTYQVDLTQPLHSKELEEILVEEYGYTINTSELESHTALDNLRSVFVPKTKTLLLAKHIDDAQKTFIYAKEIAYNYLDISERLYTFSWIKFENFDQVLNNFYASYFAGALIIPRARLVADLKSLFSKKSFRNTDFEHIINNYNASPESIYQRMTNILPKDFNLKSLFFLRFSHKKNSSNFKLNKELHLSKQQSPHANETNEHYCRRWISLKVIQDLCKSNKSHEFGIQISNYPNEAKSYLVLSSATADPFVAESYRSVSIGIQINNQFNRKVGFAKSKSLPTTQVGVTCERCTIQNCDVRQVEPKIILSKQKDEKIADVVRNLQEKFSN
ncbi:helix-turn-helix domain-containing protein [Winogradskyella bathintestinalis]|uniref:Helix-turn-helix domain-containing protein n=1 Tax=Winogradskyella bathintestinalis TaxID=3035208 RepID=A0ABT7ZVP1_9FLAO|nr:XRE family transcriptional regulator [Winogradskyella bathintestinalis]MDN3493042.1 helix-turn-helix domain-containing protein [Winogradskyella bathintestinalis]